MPIVNINSLDGSSFDAWVALPPGGSGPGLVLLHEIFGITQPVKDLCESYAQQGYVVICPHLFWRQGPLDSFSLPADEPDWARATKTYRYYDVESGLRDLFSITGFLRQMKECSGKVGVLGFCLGSRLAFLLAARSDIDCSVGYYGVGIDSFLDEAIDIRIPVLLHLAEQDKLMPETTLKKLLDHFARTPTITTRLYPAAEHGFARDGDSKFHPESAALAKERTDSFLKEHLFE